MRIEEFTFSAPSIMRLSETLYNLISAGRLRLFPDGELERELLALQVRQTAVGWRVDHQRGGFSDRAVSLGLAALHAVERGARSSILPGYGTFTREQLEDMGSTGAPEMAG